MFLKKKKSISFTGHCKLQYTFKSQIELNTNKTTAHSINYKNIFIDAITFQ